MPEAAIQIETKAGPPRQQFFTWKLLWLIVGIASLLSISFMPARPGLSTAGQRVLGILIFAIIMWVSEAVPYVFTAISSIVFLTLFLGFAPAKGIEGPLLGTRKALQIAVAGFVTNGTILVTAALFMTAAIGITGLEKRIAFRMLKIFGAKTNRVFIGIIAVAADSSVSDSLDYRPLGRCNADCRQLNWGVRRRPQERLCAQSPDLRGRLGLYFRYWRDERRNPECDRRILHRSEPPPHDHLDGLAPVLLALRRHFDGRALFPAHSNEQVRV